MLRNHYLAELRTPRRTRAGAMLVQAAVAATVGLASAVSGGAVALHLGVAPPTGGYAPRPHSAATAAIAPAPAHNPVLLATTWPSVVPPRPAADAVTLSPPSAIDPPPSAPAAAAPPIAERELTFAWGYAQRHPGAAVRRAEAPVVAALAGARAQATAPSAQRRRAAERHRATIARREIDRLSPARSFAGFDPDPHQRLGYADERPTNGFVAADRLRRPAGSNMPNPRNHEQTRS
jgi:hypothetical protein